MNTQVSTRVTGERQHAEQHNAQQCGMRAAAMMLHLINDGWTLRGNEHGYTLTPPATRKEQRQ